MIAQIHIFLSKPDLSPGDRQPDKFFYLIAEQVMQQGIQI